MRIFVLVLVLGLFLSGCGSPAGPDVRSTGILPFTAPSAAAGSRSWAPWPQALHDARHSAASDAPGPATGRLRWQRTLEGNVTPGPVVGVDGTIYAASNAGVLHAIDPSDGTDLWTFDGGESYGFDLSTSAAVLPDGTILWPGPQDRLHALSPDGTLLWTEQLDGLVSSPTTVDGTRVYVADSTGNLIALDVGPAHHERVWSVSVGTSSYGTPVMGPDGTVYLTSDTSVAAVAETGDTAEVRWRRDLHEDLVEVSAAVGPDGTIVVGTNGHHEFGLNPDGTVRWKFDRGAQSYSSPAVTDTGLAVFGDHQGDLNILDVTTGELRGRFTGELTMRRPRSAGVWTAPVIDRDHRMYFGTRQGHVYGFAPDGTQLFDLDTGETVDSYPALTADGALIVGGTNGSLYAIADDGG